MKQFKTQLHNTMASNRRLNLNECEELNPTDDIRTEEMLQSAAKKPLSQLLDKIAQLPEVRYEKITTVRRQISMGEYQIDEKLDATIDRLLEELIVEQ
ncbi:MAG: flagellar biosynthesis anti-sigma factor FlgM [Planctomycetaceae bacterium]|nr:flagellar biosynthesis anti-sigma factor FlgM [Planctomycetaceae bacterium]